MNNTFVDEKKVIGIFAFFVIISFLLDVSTSKCFKDNVKYDIFKTILILIILLIHHIIYTFIGMGWLFSNKHILMFYAVFLIILVTHWKLNNNKCIVTQVLNSICELKDEPFYDILYLFGIARFNYYEFIRYTYLVIVFFVTIYKISYINDMILN
jgi:hypothetical protein